MNRVLIVGDHPHCGSTGAPTGEVIRPDDGPAMFKVRLDEADLGVDECYAQAEQLQRVTSAFDREASDAH